MQKLTGKTALLTDESIADWVHKEMNSDLTPEFDQIYRTHSFEAHCEELTLEETMEKLAILSYIFQDDFRQYLMVGQNPLDNMFERKFSGIDPDTVCDLFEESIGEHRDLIKKTFDQDLERLRTVSNYGRYMLKPYQEEMDRIEKKKFYRYEYIVDKKEKMIKAQIGI